MRFQKARLAIKWILITLLGLGIIGYMHLAYVDREVPVALPMDHFFFNYWNEGYVRVSGTWTSDETNLADPLKTSSIKCEKESMTCEDVTASVTSHFTTMLDLYDETYKITRWDDQFITYEKSLQCAAYKYTIDRANKSATGIRTALGENENECGSITEKEILLNLRDGSEVYNDLFEQVTKRNLPWRYLSFMAWIAVCVYGAQKNRPSTVELKS